MGTVRHTRRDAILQAIKLQQETAETCKRDTPIPDDIGEERKIWLAINECALLAKGRMQAFEAVISAMNGNPKMLDYYGSR